MRAYTKYTKEKLEPLVRDSISVAEVLRKLGRKQCGGVATNLSKKIKKLGIDTSHFLGQKANSGSRHKGGSKRTWQEVLVVSKTDRREKAVSLRRALVESGREYKCEECGVCDWNDKELVLQVDHKDNNWLDNRPENLQFLCPNCHSQTEGHSGSQGMTDLFSSARYNRERRKKNVRVM